jgi:hypothetical protein
MVQHWRSLPESERDAFWLTLAFVGKRLNERETVEWALNLGSTELAERLAVLEALDHARSEQLGGVWRQAWRLIEEAWEERQQASGESMAKYSVAERLNGGERTGALGRAIADLVRPYVSVGPLSKIDTYYRKPPRTPKHVRDLMTVNLESGEVVDPAELGLNKINDSQFLRALGHELESAVAKGLDLGRRLLDPSEERLWRLGELRRAYFVPEDQLAEGEHEPDAFHKGIAPSVKLLHAVVAQIAKLNLPMAKSFAKRWHAADSPVLTRLWAAIARDPTVVDAKEVGAYLGVVSDVEFWDLSHFPEVAELRARRFPDLLKRDQAAVLKRVLKGPPARLWARRAAKPVIAQFQQRAIARELRRIQVAGGDIAEPHKSWLDEQLGRFEELRAGRIDEGFLGTPKAAWVPPNPDARFDLLDGGQRLEELEADLASDKKGWNDAPADRAADWINTSGNVERLLSDLAIAPGNARFVRVWDRFGWQHTPTKDQGPDDGLRAKVATQVMTLLDQLPTTTIKGALQGLTRWLETWARHVPDQSVLVRVWLRMWPLAAHEANAQHSSDADSVLSIVVQTPGRDEPQDLDTLNTPAGRLVGAFLQVCPTVSGDDRPFDNPHLRTMRDTAVGADGRAGLIAKHRLIEQIPYFIRADPEWTEHVLLRPLMDESTATLALWRAVARRTQFGRVLEIIGPAMALRACDERLGRETRQSLAFSLVVETLHAFRATRSPAVANAAVQQMLRSVDEDIRPHAADAVSRFVRDVADRALGSPEALSPEVLFTAAVKPFLALVWPQERSLVTPGVSRSFADLPYACREQFVNAVGAVERFLVPFDAWSLMEYGLHGTEDDEPRLTFIDSADKAAAFLTLLNSTVGGTDRAVVPTDLARALDRIQAVAPSLAESPAFKRLAMLSRR